MENNITFTKESFSLWHETHFEVVRAITIALLKEIPSKVIEKYMDVDGFVGLYQLAVDLTNEFETLNKGRQWDGEFFEEIESFMDKKLKQ